MTEITLKNLVLEPLVAEEAEPTNNSIKFLGFVIAMSTTLGLLLNWLAMYLRIGMGFVGVGIGSMVILLIARYVLLRRQVLSRKNLVVVAIVFSSTSAVEASISLLFLIWLTKNISFYNTEFNPPFWLLPSAQILNSNTIFSSEWVFPLLTHYFLMAVPGTIGIALGWIYKDKFIEEEEEYPFPNTISQDTQIGVLTDEARTKGPLFWKLARLAFVVALATTLIPAFYLIDLSNPANGFLLGIILGPIGIALLAAGILIGKTEISIGAFSSSILAYSILSIWIVGGRDVTNIFDYFSIALREVYLSPALGIILGGLIVGPIFWSIVKSLFQKNNPPDTKQEKSPFHQQEKETESGLKVDQKIKSSQISLINLFRKNFKILIIIVIVYLLSIFFVFVTGIFQGIQTWIIILVLTWILLVGGLVNGFLMTIGIAKSGSIITPPFVFDVGAIYLTGVRGVTPFVATPLAESDGTAGVVSSQKLAQLNDIEPKTAMKAYIIGYIAATLTTPLFALLLWSSFGIGTAQFPAPAFPVQGAIVMAFATGNVSSFLSIPLLLTFLVLGIALALLNTDLALGLAIGLFFPPHMAIPFAIGGIIRWLMDQQGNKTDAKEKASIIGPSLAVGGSFVIPILIILNFLS